MSKFLTVSDYEYERRLMVLITNYQKLKTTEKVDSSTKINNVPIAKIAGSNTAYPRIIKWINEILTRKGIHFGTV